MTDAGTNNILAEVCLLGLCAYAFIKIIKPVTYLVTMEDKKTKVTAQSLIQITFLDNIMTTVNGYAQDDGANVVDIKRVD